MRNITKLELATFRVRQLVSNHAIPVLNKTICLSLISDFVLIAVGLPELLGN